MKVLTCKVELGEVPDDSPLAKAAAGNGTDVITAIKIDNSVGVSDVFSLWMLLASSLAGMVEQDGSVSAQLIHLVSAVNGPREIVKNNTVAEEVLVDGESKEKN